MGTRPRHLLSYASFVTLLVVDVVGLVSLLMVQLLGAPIAVSWVVAGVIATMTSPALLWLADKMFAIGPQRADHPTTGRIFPVSGIIEIGTIKPVVLVLGAGGDVGRGVVQALLDAGRPVLAIDADAGALQALQQRHPGAPLATLVAAITSDADAARLASRVRAQARSGISGVVVSLAGRHACARLLDEPAEVLRRTLDDDLMPQLFAARHLLPLLDGNTSSGYVLIGGPGGDFPWAGYGHCSIAAAALRMMARVLHDEAAGHGVRVQLLALDAPLPATSNATEPTWHRRKRSPSAIGYWRCSTPAIPQPRPSWASTAMDRGRSLPPGRERRAPARDLRDAQALLASIPTLPLLQTGRLPHETP